MIWLPRASTMRPMHDEVPSWNWQEGQVDQSQAHLKLYYVPDIEHPKKAYLVAVMSGPNDRIFAVNFMPQNLPKTFGAGPIIDGAKQEINFFIVEKGEDDPMKYLRYHCTTASNLYSHFQWVR